MLRIFCGGRHTFCYEFIEGVCRNESEKTLAGLVFAALLLYNGAVWAENGGTSARAACVIERQTGRILFAANETERLPMASTTKVMTALVALENGELDEPVTAGKNAYGVPGTSIYLGLGESLTLEQMLYGLMLSSGNDAAVAIAEHFGGSVEGFCEMMNARAAELGAADTHFVTPHGLPCEGHYTTALDLARIAAEAMGNDTFRQIVSTQRASIPWEGHEYMRVLKNKNALLRTYSGATGIKTGFTRAAGRCLVFGAEREGMELVGAVLNCGDWFNEAARLMDAAFAAYSWTELLPDGADMGEIAVFGGENESARLVLKGALAAPLALDEAATMRVELDEIAAAPQPAGAQAGWAYMELDGETLCARPIVFAEPVRREPAALRRFIRQWTIIKGEP